MSVTINHFANASKTINQEENDMERKKRIEQISRWSENDIDAIVMILSACADMGSAEGALLSVSKFASTAEMIIEYFDIKK